MDLSFSYKDANERLLTAAWDGNLAAVQRAIEHDQANPHVRDARAMTAAGGGGGAGGGMMMNLTSFSSSSFSFSGYDTLDHRPTGRTPLWWASVRGHLPIVQYLVEQHDVEMFEDEAKDAWGQSPLFPACTNGHVHVVEYLLSQVSSSRRRQHEQQQDAASQNNNNSNNNNKNHHLLQAVDLHGRQVLWYASRHGHLPVIKQLLEFASSSSLQLELLRHCDYAGKSPLWIASQQGHVTIVEYLWQQEIEIQKHQPKRFLHFDEEDDVDDKDHDSRFNKKDASRRSDEQNNQSMMITHRHHVDNTGRTPFFAACQEGRLEVVQFLWKRACCGNNNNSEAIMQRQLLETPNHDGTTPFAAACQKSQLPIVQFLRQHIIKMQQQQPQEDKNTNAVRDVASRVVNAPDKMGRTAFWYACQRGDLTVVEFLHEMIMTDVAFGDGGNNIDNGSCLQIAWQESQLHVVEFLYRTGRITAQDLLDNDDGTNVSGQYNNDDDDSCFASPLCQACAQGNLRKVKFVYELLQREDVQHYSDFVKKFPMKPFLAACGAAVVQSNRRGGPTYYGQTLNNILTVLQYLNRQHGSSVHDVRTTTTTTTTTALADSKGRSALHLLCLLVQNLASKSSSSTPRLQQGYYNMVELLLQSNVADPNVTCWNTGQTPLHVAIAAGAAAESTMDPSISSSASSSSASSDIKTTDLVDLLVKYGARLDIADYQGRLPFCMAASRRHGKNRPITMLYHLLRNYNMMNYY